MRWLSLPISVLVVALLTASGACVARCGAVPCHGPTEAENLPPCHKDKPSKAAVELCKQAVFIAAASHALPLQVFSISGTETSFVLAERATNVVYEGPSPPGAPDLRFSVVLRI